MTKKMAWAVHMFTEWQKICNFKILNCNGNPAEVLTGQLLDMMNEYLCKCFCHFIIEIKKLSGEDYPCETLYEIVLALQAHFHKNGRPIHFFNSEKFNSVHNCLDNRMRELSKKGMIRAKEQAQPISLKDEQYLWDKNILRLKTPEQLLNTFALSDWFVLWSIRCRRT